MLEGIAIGLQTALQPINLLYCFVGVFLGTLVGVLPGIGSLVTISLLLPITFHLPPTSAIIMLAGIYYGGAYGGSTASILLNLPGSLSSTVTCLDGYPMAKQGRAGIALLGCALSSFIGGGIGIILMMLFSQPIANLALEFGPAEYFAMMLLGLIAASTISSGSPIKGIAMVLLGILIGLCGTDVNSGAFRFTFGIDELTDGIGVIAPALGMFGVVEVITSIRTAVATKLDRNAVTFRSMMPTRDDISRFWWPTLRGSGIGSFFGALPGTGGTIASFMSYAIEKRMAKDPSRFGNGAIEGVLGPEAANNAADQTAFIPTMTLGIPGSVIMALIIGALLIHGIVPGPRLITDKPDLFWGLIMSFWVGNVMLLILNLPLIGIWIRVLAVPYRWMYPAILMFIAIGAYSVSNAHFEVLMVVGFGVFGYVLRLLGFSPAPMLIGMVLGPLMEEHLRRAMVLSQGSFITFIERPLSGSFMAITFLLLGWALWSLVRGKRAQRGGAS
ncbi:MAG: tripartite tricarboxylate transporter permease [Burkholderiales bacterium]